MHPRSCRLYHLFGFLLFSLHPACSENRHAESADTRLLADLSREEARELCVATMSQQRDVLMLMCVEEVFDLINKGKFEDEQCEGEWEICGTKVDEVVAASCGDGVLPKSSCEATVADFRNCYDALADASADVLHVMSCSERDSKVDGELRDALQAAMSSPECTRHVACRSATSMQRGQAGRAVRRDERNHGSEVASPGFETTALERTGVM